MILDSFYSVRNTLFAFAFAYFARLQMCIVHCIGNTYLVSGEG